MRKAAIALCLLVLAAAVGMPLIDYVGGRRGLPLSIFMLPAGIVPMFTGFMGIVGLIALLAASIHDKTPIRTVSLCLGMSLLFVIGCRHVDSQPLFLRGFAARMRGAATARELRDLARASRALVPKNEIVVPLESLTNSTCIAKLDPAACVFVMGRVVQVEWGGALIGHWGVVIRETEGQEDRVLSPGDDYDPASKVGRTELPDAIASGISVFYDF